MDQVKLIQVQTFGLHIVRIICSSISITRAMVNGGLMGPMVRVYGSLRDHLMRLQLMVGHM